MASRLSRILKSSEFYLKNKPSQFDTSIVLSKIKFVPSADEVTRSSFIVDQSICNGLNYLHGGFITACIDTVSLFANIGNSGKVAWTMNMNVDFITHVSLGEEVTVETLPIRKGTFPVLETKLFKPGGVLVAKGTTSLLNATEKYQTIAKDIYSLGD